MKHFNNKFSNAYRINRLIKTHRNTTEMSSTEKWSWILFFSFIVIGLPVIFILFPVRKGMIL